mmetsp:Transcript_614/g.1137  ORF Transcript_614/g.1137 Transcript_614/m.1137 type:complete len:91 (+) Transcript_614:118-390(+)
MRCIMLSLYIKLHRFGASGSAPPERSPALRQKLHASDKKLSFDSSMKMSKITKQGLDLCAGKEIDADILRHLDQQDRFVVRVRGRHSHHR